jgi:hypothetical protein
MNRNALTAVAAAAALVGCERNQAPTSKTEKAAVLASNECSTEKLSNLQASWGGWEVNCTLPKSGGGGSGRLVLNGIDVTVGRSVAAVLKDAKAKASLGPGEATLFTEEEIPGKFGSFTEWRRYVLATAGGKVTGVRACENFESGKYRNRLNKAALAAYGLPTSLSANSANVYMAWQTRSQLQVSGSPNFSLLSVGTEPPSFAARDERWQRRLFNELVREEDNHPGDTEAARTEVALRHCMTTDELATRMITELNSGAQPEE